MMKIDKISLEMAAELLNNDLGILDDLPVELQDTLANIYYKSVALVNNIVDPSEILGYDNLDPVSTFERFTTESARLQSEITHAGKLIKIVRDARENKGLYENMISITIDMLKYKIPKAYEKSAARRAIERKFKKPYEIVGLYDLMKDLE